MRKLFLWITFFVGLKITAQVNLIKGPYIQVGTPNSVILKWETDVPADSRLMYGTNQFILTSLLSSTISSVTHSFQINGLQPYTRYYYSIGTSTIVIQGDANNYFVTSPLPGKGGKYRFWVTGDCGNLSPNQLNCKNAYLNYNGNNITNGWLLLGDNAYFFGSDAEYNANFFAVYQTDIMKKTTLWPAPGNHDYSNGTVTTPTVPYYDIFSMPINAEAGGVASGTKSYYSFDYGNIHFISLDSYGTDVANKKMYDTTSSQALWLKQDLAANKKQWTIAYWHHPPFTMGSHNSDTETELVQIRSDFIKILERNKVDLILCGHSHDYERSKLMKGHYGAEATFTASVHQLDSSTALYDKSPNSCPYTKDSLNKKTGTVYVVAGSAGQAGGMQSTFPHDAMFYSNATDGGSLILDFEGNRLDVKWLCGDGIIRDRFTIMKEVNTVKTITVFPEQPVTLAASWPGSYLWSNLATTLSVTVIPLNNVNYWVKDTNSCLADTIKLKVLPKSAFTGPSYICAGASPVYKDNSTSAPVSWSWSVTPTLGVLIDAPSSSSPTVSFPNAGTYTLSMVASNSDGSGTFAAKTISVNLCYGAGNDLDKLVRPNPNNGSFSINVNEYYETEITILDVVGKTVLKKTLHHGLNPLTIDGSAGVYYCWVVSRNRVVSWGKIIVIK
ncbi:MAG: metallophosphoesterase [Bacteroidetes bacterium]|jgi:hypothetical protein|nr:metallophosphoesterase [Bacteroidota bacterium]